MPDDTPDTRNILETVGVRAHTVAVKFYFGSPDEAEAAVLALREAGIAADWTSHKSSVSVPTSWDDQTLAACLPRSSEPGAETEPDLRAIYERRGFVFGAEYPKALRYGTIALPPHDEVPETPTEGITPGTPQPEPTYLWRFDVAVRDFGATIVVFADHERPPKVDDVVEAWRKLTHNP